MIHFETIETTLCGGVVDNSDQSAPKQIESKDIVQLETSFYISHPTNSNYSKTYHFEIQKKCRSYFLVEPYARINPIKINKEVVKQIQEIIDKYELVKQNGIHRHTAGLPPQYWKMALKVVYKSKEELCFSHNNNPNEPWQIELFDLLNKEFIKKDIDLSI